MQSRHFTAAAPMSLHDITVYSANAGPLLVVEVNGSKNSAPDQLERLRRILMSGSDTWGADFFLIAQNNGLFLWRKGAEPGTEAEFASIKTLVREYAPSIADRDMLIPKDGMEILMYAWLDDLVLGIRQPQLESDADQLLVRTGVYDRMREGRVVVEDRS
jgi:hypothetical protein